MIILAIDPGTTESAFVVWDTEKQVFIEPHRMNKLENNSFIWNLVYPLLDEGIDLVAIEMIQNFGFQVGRSTFLTCVFIGKLQQRIKELQSRFPKTRKTEIKLYGRTTIKGWFQAKNDKGIRDSLFIRYGNPENKSNRAKKGEFLYGCTGDMLSAFALAVALTENPSLKQW